MKAIVVLLAICSVSHSLRYEQLYDFKTSASHEVLKGEDAASDKFSLANQTIVFLDKFYDSIMVNRRGFITLGAENEGFLAPFMNDLLDNTELGQVYFDDKRDEETLARATEDIQRVFDDGIAGNFEAKAVLVVTWKDLQVKERTNVHLTFQSVIATDGHSSYVIFLYPSDNFVAGELRAKVGFSGRGSEQLEELSAAELVEGGNAWAPGIWIFQVGGILGDLEGEVAAAQHVRVGSSLHRRQSGFRVTDVNVDDDDLGRVECGYYICSAENAQCSTFDEGLCCECDDIYIGNGEECIQENSSIPFNGDVSGYVIVMDPDNAWSNESANGISVHSFLILNEGRSYTALTDANDESRLILALQPMTIFTSTLGWMTAMADYPAINGLQFTGGKFSSDTYIRYTTGAYEFRIKQVYDGFQLQETPRGTSKSLSGRVTINGRLPAIEEGLKVTYDEYTQVYMKTGPGSIRSRDTRTYTVGNITHSYTIDQSIKFESCEPLFDQIPQNLAVHVSELFTGYFQTENSLRHAMTNAVSPADPVGVHPTEPTPPPLTQPPTPTEAPTLTRCEQQLAEGEQFLENNPEDSERYFIPTCTARGTYTPRQCQPYDAVCWCVDEDTGEEIPGTRTQPGRGNTLDCSDIHTLDDRTDCEIQRAQAEEERVITGSDARSIYMPRCMESGGYEPIQQLPDGSFICVDFNGRELSRSTEQPQCLTPCQLEAYVAQASNIFDGTNLFEIECTEDGEYEAKQCLDTYCYCVDNNGQEIFNSRRETTIYKDPRLNCEEFREGLRPATLPPSTATTTSTTTMTTIAQPLPRPTVSARLLFAQSMGINTINLPVSKENAVSKRLFASSDQIAVALAYDCSTNTYFWTDVSKRRIYSSEINGNGSRNEVLSTGLRSPEGIAVDFISGNIYWTDSEYDHIVVAKADGSSRTILVTGDMVNPRGIAVDPIRGRMYWTDWNRAGPKIWVADMDGQNRKVLVSEDLGLPNDITIDFYYQKVCFIDAGTFKVECMSLDGQGRHSIYQMGQTPRPHPFGLVVDGDMLYYSNWAGSRVIHAVNWRTGEQSTIAGPRGAHGKIYGVTLVPTRCPSGYNRCSYSDNGGCNNLCIPTPDGGHTCKP